MSLLILLLEFSVVIVLISVHFEIDFPIDNSNIQ